MNIAAWPNQERPRERLFANGCASLTDAELLAIVLRTGVRGTSAIELARNLLALHGGLRGVFGAFGKSGTPSRGVGPAKIAQLKAGVELARRLLVEEARSGSVLTSPEAVRDYLRLLLNELPHEIFVVLFLDSQHRLIAADEMFRGTLAQTSVYPREIVKAALERNAAAVIFAHNHPSGVAEPSHADEILTRSLKSALGLVDVQVLDHFVVAGSATTSFAERGLL